MLEEDTAPLTFRITRTIGEALWRVGCPPFGLEPQLLLQRARRQTGLHDFAADHRFEQALLRLCISANNEAQLHFFGRMGIQSMFLSALRQRLTWVQIQRKNPKVLRTPLLSPVLVVGFPRSGTTLLHRLLSLADDAKSLAAWEVQAPLAPLDRVDHRRKQTVIQFRRIAQLAPSLALKHPLHADSPEEDFWLLNASLLSPTFHIFAPLDSYEVWLEQQNMQEPYRLWASMLSSFQFASPKSRLTLKSPTHTAHVDSAVAAVPNLAIVHLHRDPVEVLGSLNSLIHTLYALVSTRRNPKALGRLNLHRLQRAQEKNCLARKNIATNILDVHYDELKSDPVGLVQRIHQHFDITFQDSHALAIRQFMHDRPQHAQGHHVYSLEECGLNEADVYRKLASTHHLKSVD